MLANTVHYVVYNGIQLNLTSIDSFDSNAESDPSGVDRIWNHVTTQVKGVANGQINTNGLTNAGLLTYLRQSLQEPRRPLEVVINGVRTINFPGGSDAKNGPITRNVKVYEFIGATIMVELTIEYWESACASESVIVTSNRWKQKTDFDADGYTTLTSTGKLIVDSSKTPLNADQFRNIPNPVFYQPQGFERTSQSYEISEDGTEMNWTVTDQEKPYPAPTYQDDQGHDQKITRWESTWHEESGLEQGGGAVIIGTLTVKAWGMKNVSKNILLLFCVRVFQSYWNQEKDVIKHYAIDAATNPDNSVALAVTVLTFSSKDFTGTKFQVTTRIATNPGIYDPGVPTTTIPNRGNAGLWLVVKDIVPTCSLKTTLTVIPSNTVNQSPTLQYSIPQTGTKVLAETTNDVNQDKNPYTLSHIETQVVENQSKIQLSRASGNVSTECFYAQTAAPVSKNVIRYHMERLNASPKLPASTLAGKTLLKNTITMSDSMLLPSGVDRIYVIRGELLVGCNQTAQIGVNDIFMPKAITDRITLSDSAQNHIGASSFVGGLIQPT